MVTDLPLGSQFSESGNAAVAKPAVLSKGAGAIENDVGFLGAFLAFGVAEQKPKGVPTAFGIPWHFLLEQAMPADAHHLRLRDDDRFKQFATGQGPEVLAKMLASCDTVAIARKLVLSFLGKDRGPAKWRGVHAERTEQTHVSPPLHIFGDATTLVNCHGQTQFAA